MRDELEQLGLEEDDIFVLDDLFDIYMKEIEHLRQQAASVERLEDLMLEVIGSEYRKGLLHDRDASELYWQMHNTLFPDFGNRWNKFIGMTWQKITRRYWAMGQNR